MSQAVPRAGGRRLAVTGLAGGRVVVAARGGDVVAAVRDGLPGAEVVPLGSLASEPPDVERLRPVDYLFAELELLAEAGDGSIDGGVGKARRFFPSARLVVVATQETLREALAAVRGGADNYVLRPVDAGEVRFVCESLEQEARVEGELDHLRGTFWRPEAEQVLRTNSARMRAVFNAVRQVAPTRATVLIRGETGTGKSLLARLIHLHSNRAGGPFVEVNCGALPESLFESELFGHERGAFTGAVRRKLGRFEIASGGTIFLDEVGTLPAGLQAKLLRVLQDGTFERVGGERTLTTDARVIAATNEDLDAACAAGSFRKDLYFRLTVFPIELPPLRERMEDLELIVETVLERLELRYGKRIFGVAPEVMDAFRSYSWPGNIRELESVLERAYLLASGRELGPAVFPPEIVALSASAGGRVGLAPLAEVRRAAADSAERAYLEALLERADGRLAEAAAVAGVTPRQLRNLLHKHGLGNSGRRRRGAR